MPAFQLLKMERNAASVSDLYRAPVEIHFSNKWRKLLVSTESYVAAYDLDDLAFKGFLRFEGRPGRIEFDAQEDFAFIQYTDRTKIEQFNLNTLRSEDEFYTRRKNFRGKEIDPSTFHWNQDSLDSMMLNQESFPF